MDPNTRMNRIAEQIRRGDRDPYTAEAYEDEQEEEAAREGLAAEFVEGDAEAPPVTRSTRSSKETGTLLVSTTPTSGMPSF